MRWPLSSTTDGSDRYADRRAPAHASRAVRARRGVR